jgi:hypothetical protein
MHHHERRSIKEESNDYWCNGYRTTERENTVFWPQGMGFYLLWIVGRQIYGGSDTGECMETAARIQNGDAES